MSFKRLGDKRSSHAGSLKARSLTGRSLDKQRQSAVRFEELDPNIVAGDIMKEIVDTALEKIHENYMENQTIKFVVHCAHQAFEKMLRIHFYQHNNYNRSPKFWSPDKRPEPSSPDSWAFHQVPQSKLITAEPELNTLSLIKLDMATKGGEITVDPKLDVVSLPSESLIEDVRATIDEMIDNLPIVDTEEEETSDSLVSTFTMVVEGIQHYEDFQMGPQLSKISLGDSTCVKLPKIDLPDSGILKKYSDNFNTFLETARLPPIRTEANCKSRSMSIHDQVKKPKDKR